MSGGGGSTPSGGNGDNKDYDGPAGMDVDGVIESTWTEVSGGGGAVSLVKPS